jgi:hypothetical protein
MAGALLLAMAGGALALDADERGATPAAGAAAAKAASATDAQAANPAVGHYQQALTALHQERESWLRSFDWSRGERAALQAELAAGVKSFQIREQELRRDWYQATGQTELLARAQESLRSLNQPAATLPEIVTDRQAAAPQAPEVTR